jgi:hypothetical protein
MPSDAPVIRTVFPLSENRFGAVHQLITATKDAPARARETQAIKSIVLLFSLGEEEDFELFHPHAAL